MWNHIEELVFRGIFLQPLSLQSMRPSTPLKVHLVPSTQPVSRSLVGCHSEALYHIISHSIWLEWQMTEKAGRRAINLKVLASIKPLGKTTAVNHKTWERGDIKSIFWCDKQFDKTCLTQITNEGLIQQRQWAHESRVPHQNGAS